MWKKLLDYFTHLLTLAEATRENKAEIAEIRSELRELALRLENELLKFERRLPPSKPGK